MAKGTLMRKRIGVILEDVIRRGKVDKDRFMGHGVSVDAHL